MPALDAVKLRSALTGRIIGREIVVLEETTSTNDSVLHLMNDTTPEGLVVFAEHQTAGRGQHGNRWESAKDKGLWFSILLRPKIELSESARLTTWAAKTVARTIQEPFSLTAKVKPPNDIYINGRKVAGVLVEMRARKNAPHLAIAGIGINLNHVPEDFPEEIRSRVTSLAMAVNRPVNREDFAIALLRDLDRTYSVLFGL